MRSALLAATLLGLTLPGVTALQAGSASASISSARAQRSGAPALARAVARAGTAKARVAAIEHVLGALHIDVINPASGAEIVPGSARTLRDGYLYLNEVAELAAAYKADIRVGLTQVAGALNRAGYIKLHHRLTATIIARALLTVTRHDTSAAVPDSVALLPRLVWQLGLLHKHPQNLDKPIKPAQISLDALQEWLVIADFAFPFINAHPVPAGPASTLRAASEGLIKGARISHSAEKCDISAPFKKILGPLVKLTGSLVGAALGKTIGSFGKYVVPIIPELIDLIHAGILVAGITITTWGHPTETHLGGPDMHFHIGIRMNLHLSPWVVSCGWLLGDSFPGYGPVSGVLVAWNNGTDTTDTSTLEDWGTFASCGLACSMTGDDGVASETFTPYPEPVSHGILKETRGAIAVVPFTNVSNGNILGFLGDFFREDAIAWSVYHRVPHGWPTRIEATASFNDRKAVGGDFRTVGSLSISGAVQSPKCAPPSQSPSCSLVTAKISGTVAGQGCGAIPASGEAQFTIWSNGNTGELFLNVTGDSGTCTNSDDVQAPLRWQSGDVGGEESITNSDKTTIIGTITIHYLY